VSGSKKLNCRECGKTFEQGVDIQHYNAIFTYGKCENCYNPLLQEGEYPNIYENDQDNLGIQSFPEDEENKDE
jgi:hypothetical protein